MSNSNLFEVCGLFRGVHASQGALLAIQEPSSALNVSVAAIAWYPSDVLVIRPDLTREQAQQVLDAAKEEATGAGINWSLLAKHADNLFGEVLCV